VKRFCELKSKINAGFPPAYPNGRKLGFNGRLFQSEYSLEDYHITDDATTEMDDTESWESESTEDED
jgi:hypothetical protein